MSSKSQQEKEEQAQEEVWREIFNLFDKDGNGKISDEELGHVLRALDLDPTQKELDDAVKELDKDGNGVIEFSDFKSYMNKKKTCSYDERKQEMLRAFRLIDKNNDKFIDARELMGVLTKLGEPLSEEEVKAMIRVADVNKDGKIDYEEFVDFILSPCIGPQRNSFCRRQTSKQSNTSLPQQQRPPPPDGRHESRMSTRDSAGFFYTADVTPQPANVPDRTSSESWVPPAGVYARGSMNNRDSMNNHLALNSEDSRLSAYPPVDDGDISPDMQQFPHTGDTGHSER
ncbi:calmodulin-like protein 3 [Aplysia californica]|uniref:Calmodulin-like protein 3 n=1 Tax=Aplysia californica TaxID=6500 RepID=A0ABM1A9D8_APLCA|nr:calmodulin-like protein 3 [Aplysia californica]